MKYIVYITVNLCNGKIYIGVHKTNPEIFDGYIGCGIYRQSNAKENIPFHNAVKKYGYKNFRRTTIAEFPLTEEGKLQAYDLERQIVNSTLLKSKYVYNSALGGGSSFRDTKRVYQFALNGEYLNTFKSCEEAAIKLEPGNITSCLKSIRNCCLGTTQSAYGYYWSYNKEFNHLSSKNITPVAQYTLSGKFLRYFDSITEAEVSLGLNSIEQAITKKYQCGGYQWKKYEGDNSDIPALINTFTKFQTIPILMLDKKGNLIKEYNSVQDCVNENPQFNKRQISRVLKGVIKTHKGYSFKLKDEDIVSFNLK